MIPNGAYSPLRPDDPLHENDSYDEPERDPKSQGISRSIFTVSLTLNAIFLVTAIIFSQHMASELPPHLYSPAEGVAQYTLKRFTTSVGAKATEYQGPPSPTLDRLWSDLHLTAMTIPKDQAIKLPNKTSAVSADPDAQYIVGLSVLHDLHCLDNIRHSLNYFYYKQWGNSTLNPGNTPIEELDKDHDKGGIFHVDHMSHCLDMVRQSLMCHADTTPVVWQWSDRAAGIQISLDVVHTCRDFDAVRRWAEEHRYDEPFDNRVPLAEAGHCRELDPNCEN